MGPTTQTALRPGRSKARFFFETDTKNAGEHHPHQKPPPPTPPPPPGAARSRSENLLAEIVEIGFFLWRGIDIALFGGKRIPPNAGSGCRRPKTRSQKRRRLFVLSGGGGGGGGVGVGIVFVCPIPALAPAPARDPSRVVFSLSFNPRMSWQSSTLRQIILQASTRPDSTANTRFPFDIDPL